MKRTFIRIICWVLFAWFFYYFYYFVIWKIMSLITYVNESDVLPIYILAGVLDIITVLVIYGEKIRKNIKESICLKTSDENKKDHP